ncbi:ead/Ea22-like family protein [Escherichia coli]|nr:ead/Ea22-like family protein [Escherichia coli]
MSNIDKQALREAAERAESDSWGYDRDEFNEALTPSTVLALLDELEAKDKRISELKSAVKSANDRYENRTPTQWAYDQACLALEKHRARAEAAEKRIAELEARAFNPAILDVIAERQRQQSVEGWMPEHDDEHCNGELAMAAVCYINETGTVNRNGGKPWGWPWDASWWKPNARRRNLVKAGALILAEIERIDRAAGIGKGE